MNYRTLRNFGLLSGTLVAALGLAAAPAAALATPGGVRTANTADTTAGTGNTAADTKLVQLIISRGNNEITRRLTTLNKLESKINSAAKLSSSDKSELSSEVTNEVSGLTALKTQLDGETQLANAKNDAQSIFSDYRVYALIAPKVYLVKTADDQQAAEAKLSSLAAKIQKDITVDENAGKDATSLQATMTDMNAKVQSAQGISGNIEGDVIALMPSDYNSNHALLDGDRDQLKTAQADLTAAISDAKSLVNSLNTL